MVQTNFYSTKNENKYSTRSMTVLEKNGPYMQKVGKFNIIFLFHQKR